MPHGYIKFDSYSIARRVQDLDSYRDANGVLHREALEHVPLDIEFETPAMMTNITYADFMSNIRTNYTKPQERRVIVTAYVPETDNYVTQEMYFADPEPSIYMIKRNVIYYNPIRVSIIGY